MFAFLGIIQNCLFGILCGLLGVGDCTSFSQESPPPPNSVAPLTRFEYTRPTMGTQIKIVLFAADESQAAFAINAVLEDLEEQSRPINNYKSDSEVSNLANLKPGSQRLLSSELGDLLLQSKRWHDLSLGAFDVTAGATLELWSNARKQKKRPTDQEIAVTKEHSGWKHIHLSKEGDSPHAISVDSPGIRINVSGIATGYLIDHAMDVMRHHGITSALIDIGGDVIVSDSPPGSDGWKISVAGLSESEKIVNTLNVRNCAVTTSGDLNQFTEIDGVRYSHLIDPATHCPIPRRVSATVVAKRAIDADAGATAVAVLGIDKAKPLLANLPIDSVMILEQNHDDASHPTAITRTFQWTRSSP